MVEMTSGWSAAKKGFSYFTDNSIYTFDVERCCLLDLLYIYKRCTYYFFDNLYAKILPVEHTYNFFAK